MIDPATGCATRPMRLRRLITEPTKESAKAESSKPTVASLFVWAQWFGLVTGLIELGLLLFRNYLYGTATLGSLQLSQHFAWMIPVTHLLIFSVVGIALTPLALWKSQRARTIAVFALATLLAFALLATIPGLHRAACVALAIGLASRLAPLIGRRTRGFQRLVRWSYPPLLGTVAVLIGVGYGRAFYAERWAQSQVPAARAGAPNVLLVVMDTVRADRMSLHGYGRDTTPNLSRLARSGVRFDQARATAPWTLPSHASMFTGRYQHELRVFVNRPLDASFPTLAEYLRDRGYLTAGFVANTHFCNSWYGLGRGFARYEDYYRSNLVVSFGETFRSAELGRRILQVTTAQQNVRPGDTNFRKDADRINADLLAWLGQRRLDRPFFAFLNYFDVHDPYVVPPGFDRRLGLVPTTPADFALLNSPHVNERLASGKDVTPREVDLVRDAYDDCLSYLDDRLGRLFAELERRGELSNTLVIVTSDHGEHLGEHAIYGHGQSLYRPETHVPLLVIPPGGLSSSRIVSDPVSLRDLAATVVDRLGLSDGSPFPGRSLSRFWDASSGHETPTADPILSELIRGGKPSPTIRWPPALRGPMHSVVADGKTYIRNGDGAEELYDLAADPGELHDLSSDRAALEPLRATGERLRREGSRPEVTRWRADDGYR